MPIIFNLSGLAMAALAAAVGFMALSGVASTSPTRDVVEQAAGLAGFAVVAAAFDFYYRRRRNPHHGKGRFFSPLTGGSLMFLPVWFIGVAAMGLAVYLLVTCPESNLDVMNRHRAAVEAKVAQLDAARTLIKTAPTPDTPASPLTGLDPKPFVDRPAGRANTAFMLFYGADNDVNGRHYESVFTLASWFGIGAGGKSSLYSVRSCAGVFSDTIEAGLAIEYLVGRQSDKDTVFSFVELKSGRRLATFSSAPTAEAMREALTRLTGGTFMF